MKSQHEEINIVTSSYVLDIFTDAVMVDKFNNNNTTTVVYLHKI